jgi:hypothetical protein
MRSYSSLLCHILASNPAISGYIEQHQEYQTHLDLLELRIKVAHTTGNKLVGTYVLDKLLHNKADISPEILKRDDVFCLFLVREPEQTIKSTLAMVGRKKPQMGEEGNWKSDPASYYVRRLERLIEVAADKPQRSAFLDADRLVEATEPVLSGLTRFLELEQPLSASYETFEFTGKPRLGDPGKFISAGQIVRERKDYSDIDVPEEDILRAKEAFEMTRTMLGEHCQITL